MTTAEMGKAKALQRQWSKQAQKKRKAYLEGDISATAFHKYVLYQSKDLWYSGYRK